MALTTRVFFVGGSLAASDVESLCFAELPRIPIPAGTVVAEGATTETRPLVSPMLHLGRQSALLQTALKNDRRWSRRLLEVTSWCIHGLGTGNDAVPIDAATLPFAGVRVRLCGSVAHPIQVLHTTCFKEQQRVVATLAEAGACAWLQHGDVLDFGNGARLTFLAVHVRTGLASELARKASFLWVQANPDTTALPIGVPVATWSTRYADWATIPKFLKAKLLAEAAQLLARALAVAAAAAAEEEEAEARLRASASTAVPSTHSRVTNSPLVEENNAVAAGKAHLVGDTPAPPGGAAVGQGEMRGLGAEEGFVSRSSSETRHDACAVTDDIDMDAATPTSESQQQQRQRQRQQRAYAHRHLDSSAALSAESPLLGLARTRSAPDVFGAVSEALPPVAAPQSASQGQSPSSVPHRLNGSGQPRPSALSVRASGTLPRPSLATFTETMDDKLFEALLNLENGGGEISNELARRQREPAMLLGTVDGEDDDVFHATRSAPPENTARHGGFTTPTRCEEERVGGGRREIGDGLQQIGEEISPSRRSAKRSGRTKASPGGRRSRAEEGEECVVASTRRQLRHTSSPRTSPSQPLRGEDGGRGAVTAPPPLTRADMKRMRGAQPVEEDSQVVYFEH